MIRNWFANISLRVVGIIVAVIAAVLIVGFTVRSCDVRRSKASQARVERSQAQAASDSARDAINAVQASGEAERASEETTRQNDREIRNAPGASDRVNSGVDLAGRKALCRRKAYANDPKCKVLKP